MHEEIILDNKIGYHNKHTKQYRKNDGIHMNSASINYSNTVAGEVIIDTFLPVEKSFPRKIVVSRNDIWPLSMTWTHLTESSRYEIIEHPVFVECLEKGFSWEDTVEVMKSYGFNHIKDCWGGAWDGCIVTTVYGPYILENRHDDGMEFVVERDKIGWRL